MERGVLLVAFIVVLPVEVPLRLVFGLLVCVSWCKKQSCYDIKKQKLWLQ